MVFADTYVSSFASPSLLRSWSPWFGFGGSLGPPLGSWLVLALWLLCIGHFFGWSPLALLLFIIQFPIEGYGHRSVRKTRPKSLDRFSSSYICVFLRLFGLAVALFSARWLGSWPRLASASRSLYNPLIPLVLFGSTWNL